MAKRYILDSIQRSPLIVAGSESVVSVERVRLSVNTPGVVTINLHLSERPITLVQTRVGVMNQNELERAYDYFESRLIHDAQSNGVFNTRLVRESMRTNSLFGPSIRGFLVKEIGGEPFDFSLLRLSNRDLIMELIFDPLGPADHFLHVGVVQDIDDFEETYGALIDDPSTLWNREAVYGSIHDLVRNLEIKGVDWNEPDEFEWIRLEEIR